MLKKQSEFFKSLLLFSDFVILSGAWFMANHLWFKNGVVFFSHDILTVKPYLVFIVPLLITWFFVFNAFGLYRPRRLSTRLSEVFDIAKACTLTVIILICFTFFVSSKFALSKTSFLYFWLSLIVALSLSRIIFREGLRVIRRKGYNLRHVIIVGDGVLAREVIKRLGNHPEVGINILGLFGSGPERVGRSVYGKKIIGTYDDIEAVLLKEEVDQVFIAIPFSEMMKIEEILRYMSNYQVDVRIVPDVFRFSLLQASIEEFDGLPILNMQGSPLFGWNLVMKRLLDFTFASFAIVVTLPLMLIIAVAIKLTSPGPVLYKQKRVGFNGKVFTMLKFRTMAVDAEKETGAVWTKENDSRKTLLGGLLRRTSLDELPQFFNVLKGNMSIVGPRPERPEFIKEFKGQIPKYLLRHHMKAGITGWAQVNGWRGNTSLEKRIEHDLYYIEHWSILLDLKIMLFTVWTGFINRNAY